MRLNATSPRVAAPRSTIRINRRRRLRHPCQRAPICVIRGGGHAAARPARLDSQKAAKSCAGQDRSRSPDGLKSAGGGRGGCQRGEIRHVTRMKRKPLAVTLIGVLLLMPLMPGSSASSGGPGKACNTSETSFPCHFECETTDVIVMSGTSPRGTIVDGGAVCGGANARCTGMNDCVGSGNPVAQPDTGRCELYEGGQVGCASAETAEEAVAILCDMIPTLYVCTPA